MIVYLDNGKRGVFVASKARKNSVVSKQFSCARGVERALAKAIEWEKPKQTQQSQRNVVKPQVFPPEIEDVDGKLRVVVNYVNRDLKRRKVTRLAGENNKDKVARDAYRVAHVMAGITIPNGV